MGASDLALTLDGPLGENTTFIASYRRSYLQFLFKALQLPFLPKYNDYQFKVRSRNYLHNESLKYQDNIMEEDFRTLDYNSDEIENKFRYEHTSSYKSGLRVNYGANFEYAKFYANNYYRAYINDQPVTYNNEAFFDLFKWGAFGQVSKEMLSKRLVLSL